MAKARISPELAVGGILIFGAAFALVIPQFQSANWFLSLNPVEQYILWNLGIILLFTGIFGVLVNAALRKRFSIANILLHGIAGFIVFSFVIDMIEPPFALNAMGQFIIPAGATLEGTSVDFMTAWLYQTAFGISGPLLFWLTYLVTPALAIILFVIVLGPKKLLKIYGGSA